MHDVALIETLVIMRSTNGKSVYMDLLRCVHI